MAIIDKSQNKWYTNDRDENVSIGLRIPLVLDNGELASTKTTLEAVKQNVLNLCSTETGERVMQPNLGITLKRFLFEQFTDESRIEIENEIIDTFKFWLPFVEIKKLIINMDENYDIGRNKLKVDITFNINKDPNTLASVQVDIGD